MNQNPDGVWREKMTELLTGGLPGLGRINVW